jgi:hypothetical protein
MTNTPRWIAAAALLGLAASATASQASDDTGNEASTWQHHQVKLNYFGFTSAYSCDGLEGKVGMILKYFGARDPKVQANGCPRGPNSISHSAWIDVQFDTLAAAAADAPPAAIVQARWTPIQLNAQHPFFMGGGDCELIDAMKPMLIANFSLRNLSYRAACTPHEITLLDFKVDGEVLKSTAEHPG